VNNEYLIEYSLFISYNYTLTGYDLTDFGKE